MKRFLIMLTCLTGIINTYGQSRSGQAIIEVTKANDSSIFIKVQVLGFPVEDSAYRSNLERQIKATIATDIDKHAKNGEYALAVYFIISKEGYLSDIQCSNDPGYGICEAAIRVLKKGKTWIPGKGYQVYPYRN